MLHLQEAGLGNLAREAQFVSAMPVDENGLTNSWHGVTEAEYAQKTLCQYRDFAAGRNLPGGFVPETFYFLWQGDKIVGQFRLRHHLTAALSAGAGHIGYYIAPAFRGQGLATEGLRLLLDIARGIVPEDEIYLRVNRDNPASLHVMLKCGGYIHHEDAQKYYVRIKNSKGEHEA